MRYLLILILLLMFGCNQETNSIENQKRNDSILRVFVLKLLFTPPYTDNGIPESCAWIQPSDWNWTTNLKSIDIYFNKSLFFSNSINSGSISWELSCEPPRYVIILNENSKLKAITVFMKYNDIQKKYEYISVRLLFKDNTLADYPMNFNGDPDTFTEFTAGEYRFVAVR